jgi:vitamin B12 transporter
MHSSNSLHPGGQPVAAAFSAPLTWVAAAAMTLCSLSAQAQSAAAGEQRMAETVVTATRSAISVDETLADVAVISQEQIESMAPVRSAAELLQRLAGGVQLSSNGGRGAAQSVFLRGTASTQTLLLIDGVRYGSATMAAPVLENLPLEMIERIEVVKGPASALYGSEAIGGVIQVFTKRGADAGKPFLGNASVTAGENGYKAASAGLRGAQNGFDYQIGLNRLVDHGFSATNPKAGPYTYNPDRDGFDQTSVNLGLGYALNSDWRVDTNFLQSDGRVHTDSGLGSNPYSDLKTRVAKLKLTGKVLPNWTTYVSVGQSRDEQKNFGSPYGDSHFNTTQLEYKWDNEIRTMLGTVLAGAERLEQKVDVSSDYAVTRRSINAVFLGLNGSAGRHSWQGNVRRDDNSQFGGMTTYGLSYGYEFIQGLRAYASHGKSMRAPSFNDLYYVDPSYPMYNGNPNLRPEEGRNNEIGLQWNQGIHRAKLLHFDNKVSNLIAFGSTGMTNLQGETRLKGWSLEYGVNVAGWGVSANYDYLDAKQADGRPVLRRAKNQFALNVDKRLGAWKLGGSLLHVSSRKDTDFNTYATVTLPAYTTMDLYAEYRINPEWSLQARVANVGNKHYETVYGFNQLGRAGYLTLKWAMR